MAGPTALIFLHESPIVMASHCFESIVAAMAEHENGGHFETGLTALMLVFHQVGDHPTEARPEPPVIRKNTPEQIARWQSLLDKLPKARFERQQRRLRVEIRGLPDLDFCDDGWVHELTQARFRAAAVNVVGGLRRAKLKLRQADDVNLDALLAAVVDLGQRDWADTADLKAKCQPAYESFHERLNLLTY